MVVHVASHYNESWSAVFITKGAINMIGLYSTPSRQWEKHIRVGC